MPLSLGLGTLLGGVGGSIISGLFGRQSASTSMGFQERMSKTQHQREVADLRAAGLNPILSATGGSGNASPGGAMPATPDFGSTALSAMRMRSEINKLDAETELTDAKTGVITPISDIGKTGGVITKHLPDAVRSKIERLPSSAKGYKTWAQELFEALSPQKRPFRPTGQNQFNRTETPYDQYNRETYIP